MKSHRLHTISNFLLYNLVPKNTFRILVVFSVLIWTYGINTIAAAEPTDSVVKIFVAKNEIDYYRPWQSKGMSASGGSGIIIKGNKILTNAHVVSDATFIQVKKRGSPKKYTAHVKAIGHDCDLALLEINDSAFFKNMPPTMSFGELPKLQDTVTVLGYPQGGDKISITEGVVSRIELTSYSQSARKLLAVQIDAAINPGNSGGPVIKDGQIVGIAMQRLNSGQNIGYMIPVPIIKHFFKDLEDKTYDGFPMLGIEFNSTENEALRQRYKITDYDGGILITKVLPFTSAENRLKKGDVVYEINNTPIGEDGTFIFQDKDRLALSYLITSRQVGERLKLGIVRDGKRKKISLKLKPFQSLVPHPRFYERPPYFIYGGFVFTVLTTDLLKSWGNRWFEKAPNDLLYYLVGKGRINENKDKNKIVMLRVLPDDINAGYHNYGPAIIETVNDKRPHSFKEFIDLIMKEQKKADFITFYTHDNMQLVITTDNIGTINQKIMQRNNIPHQSSDEVRTWLK